MNALNDAIGQQTLALAAVFQATNLVHHIAHEGFAVSEKTDVLITSIFETQADSFEAIYGDLASLSQGCDVLSAQLGQPGAIRSPEVARYTAQLLGMQKKVAGNRQMLGKISESIDAARPSLDTWGLRHENTLARLADIYVQNISQMSPRIRISGSQTQLENADTANLVRTLLLAGLRAAVLWRQVGGSRWKLLFRRTRYLQRAQVLKSALSE